MSSESPRKIFAKVAGIAPLRMLIVPLVLQISATVGLMGYLCFRNEQQAVNNLTHQLMIQAAREEHLEFYPVPQAQLVAADLKLGINLSPLQNLEADLSQRIKRFNPVSLMLVGKEQGKFIGAYALKNEIWDWLIIIVVPAKDFLEQINANNLQTMLLCIAALMGYIAIGMIVVAVRKHSFSINAAAREILSKLKSKKTVISDRQIAETALKQSDIKFRLLAENLPFAVYRFVRHPDGTHGYTYVSPRVRNLYEYEAEAIMQNPQLPWEITHPDDVASLNQSILFSAQTLQPWQWEGRIIPASGRLKWVQGISRPEKQPNGDIIWDGIVIEITERKQAEKLLEDYNFTLETQVQERTALLAQEIAERKQIETALRQSEARYRAILEDQSELIARFQPDGIVTFVNEAFCRFFGLTRTEAIGHHYQPVVFEEDREHVVNLINSIGKKNPVVKVENRVIVQEQVRWTQWINRGIFDEAGCIVEFQAVGRDITDLKQAEVELRQAKEAAEAANRAKSIFLANMSHELRTPLNAILGFAQLLKYDCDLNAQQQENVRIISTSGEHLLSLINDVLDLSKIEAGRIVIKEIEFDLLEMLNELKQMFQIKANGKGLELEFDLAGDVPQFIASDRRKLRQVLINLIGNGIKFTNEGKVSLTVTTVPPFPTREEGLGGLGSSCWLIFAVSDTGVGIGKDELEHLFTPFVQSKAGIATAKGAGLGLTISRKYVEFLGGDIAVNSQPGRGTTFQFKIKVMPVNPASVIALAANQPSYSILVVDDLVVGDRERNFIEEENKPNKIDLDYNINLAKMQALPKSWLSELEQAILNQDCDAIAQLILRIQPQETALASALKKTVENLEYQKILQAIVLVRRNEIALEGQAGFEQNMSLPAKLPSQWVSDMKQAISLADLNLIEELINKIKSDNSGLAQIIQEHLDNFDYKSILAIILDIQESN